MEQSQSQIEKPQERRRTLEGEFNKLKSRATRLSPEGDEVVGFDITQTLYTQPDHLKLVVNATMKPTSGGVELTVSTTLGKATYHQIKITEEEINETQRTSKARGGVAISETRYNRHTREMTVNGSSVDDWQQRKALIQRSFEAITTSNRLIDNSMNASK